MGLYRPDKGEIYIRGERVDIQSPHDAIALGVGMIHQHFKLVDVLTVRDNIVLGTRGGSRKQVDAKIRELSQRFALHIDPDRKIYSLSVGEKQMVEIMKVLYRGARTLILDEPTAVLTPQEIDRLFAILRRMKKDGCAIIIITHKLNEVMEISDRVSILRKGRSMGTVVTSEIQIRDLIERMVGESIDLSIHRPEPQRGGNVLDVHRLSVLNADKVAVLSDVSFAIARGEILGVAGLVGAGRSEVMESLFGMERFDSGEVLIDGAPVTIDSPSVAIEKGMALLTEDRKKSGLFLVLSVLENMSIVKMPEYIGKSGFVQHVKMAEDCMEQIRRLNIKTPTMDQIINNLSGGNQQKVLIARWLLAQPKILILDEPTRGIDVGAKAEIYHLISELANRGVAVIMVSSELPEILGMSDRVMVMHEGRITGILEKDEADQETILSLASH